MCTGVLHPKRGGGGTERGGCSSRGVLSYHRHDEHGGEGPSGPTPPQRMNKAEETMREEERRDGVAWPPLVLLGGLCFESGQIKYWNLNQ